MKRIVLGCALLLATGSLASAEESKKAKPEMKTFLDSHKGMPKGLPPEATAAEHKKDVEIAKKQFPHVHFTQYWYDSTSGSLTCECQAPSADDCVAVHKAAHDGHGPDEIHEVVRGK